MGKNLSEVNVDFMIVSDYAFVGENGKLNIIGVFDIIGVSQFPSGHPELFVVAKITGKENSEHEIEINLEDPDGENLLVPIPPKLKVKLSGTGDGSVIQRFFNLNFKKAGVHKFQLLKDGKKISKAKLTVMKITNGKITNSEPN